MLIAIRFPDSTQGKKITSFAANEVSPSRVRFATWAKGDVGCDSLSRYTTRKKRTSAETAEVSARRVREARTVLHQCPQYVDLVIDGSMGLDDAYREANRLRVANLTDSERRENEARQHAARFKAISDHYPDIAEMGKGEKLSLDE